MNLESRLAAIASTSTPQKDRPQLYRAVIDSLLPARPSSTPPPELTPALSANLETYLSHAVDESIGLVNSRQLLSDFVALFHAWYTGAQVPSQTDMETEGVVVADLDAVVSVWNKALDKMQMRAVAFEDQVRCLSGLCVLSTY